MRVQSSTITGVNKYQQAGVSGFPTKEPQLRETVPPAKANEVQDTGRLDGKTVTDAVEKMNKTARIFNKSLHFRLHEESKRWQVQVIDLDSGKVIREIPPSEILDVVAKIQEIVGVFVDDRR